MWYQQRVMMLAVVLLEAVPPYPQCGGNHFLLSGV
jgi:hypothetical protein